MSLDFSHGADAHVQPALCANFYADGLTSRYDEQGSMSGPEDGGYASFSDTLKVDTDTEDDNSALTSQTLNADGTPKRPMNAFMIFARRRRPQVSAENQCMRTGEISKILSKEWNTMQAREKQFYQDQAKQLKDAFNSRYPDYVYRRRPNNSRRKRKPDGSAVRQVDKTAPLDMGDDVSGIGDVGESPTDSDDTQEVPPDWNEVRQSSYGDFSRFASPHAPSPSFPYPVAGHPLQSNGAHDSSLLYDQDPYSANQLHGPPLSASVAPPQPAHPLPYPRSYPYLAPLFGSEYSHETYIPVVRPAAWPLGSGHDCVAAHKSHSFSTSANSSAWPHRPSEASNPTLDTTFSPTYVLPTLNSPFYPNQTPSQSSISDSTYSPHAYSVSRSPGLSQSASSPGRDYNNSAYPSTLPRSHPNAASGRTGPFYPRRNSSPYSSHFQLLPPPSSGPGAPPNPSQAYWSRD